MLKAGTKITRESGEHVATLAVDIEAGTDAHPIMKPGPDYPGDYAFVSDPPGKRFIVKHPQGCDGLAIHTEAGWYPPLIQ